MEDGAGDEVGEEGDEEDVGDDVLLLGDALLQVDEVGDLGKGEEGDAERKDDFAEVMRADAGVAEEVEERKQVLEVNEGADVDDDGGDDERAFPLFRRTGDGYREEVVEQDGGEQEKDILRIPEAVEVDRSECQPGKQGDAAEAARDLEADEGDGEEKDEEDVGREEHGVSVSPRSDGPGRRSPARGAVRLRGRDADDRCWCTS